MTMSSIDWWADANPWQQLMTDCDSAVHVQKKCTWCYQASMAKQTGCLPVRCLSVSLGNDVF